MPTANAPKKGIKVAKAKKSTGNKGGGVSPLARLITNPCNGSLVVGPQIGTTGGFVSRFQSNYMFGKTAGQDTVLLGLCPTALTSLTADASPQTFRASAVKWAGGTYSGGGFVSGGGLMNQINGWCPGSTYLETNARRYRPLAACLQIMAMAPLQTQTGVLFAGECSHDDLSGANPNIDSFLDSSRRVVKATDGGLEVVWRPDEESTTPFNMGSSRPNGDDRAIYVGGTGLTAATGVMVRLVVVWEWWPFLANAAKPDTNGDLNNSYFHKLIQELQRWEPGWFVRLMNAGAPIVRGLITG